MHVHHVSSSESRPCVICGKKTSTFKEYEQTNIVIRIPACNEECFGKLHITNFADLAIKLLNNAIELKGDKDYAKVSE